MRPGKLSGFAALILAATLTAQRPASPAAPAFDVGSIRPVPPNAPIVMREQDFTPILPGGQYVNSRDSLANMICIAYGCRYPDRQLIGLPTWAKNQGYAVAAKAAERAPALSPTENSQQVRLMLRAMLADRFHLRLHTETRQESVYKLEPAKGGIKMRDVDPPVPPAKAGNVGAAMRDDGGIRMVARKSTMAGLTSALSLLTGRPVIDESGLNGYYDFDVTWQGPEASNGQVPETRFGGPELIGLLISNLREQFGLRLSSTIGPVEYWIVDHVEPPTDN